MCRCSLPLAASTAVFVLAVLPLLLAGAAASQPATPRTPAAAPPNMTLDLGGSGWKLTNANGSVEVEGTVPGSVHTDLMAAGVLGNPYYRYNDDVYRWVIMDNWTYTLQFDVPYDMLTAQTQLLVCEGLDTVAELRLNGALVAQTSNMFQRYMLDVSGLLGDVGNVLTVSFTSAVQYAAAQAAAYPYAVPLSSSPSQNGEPNVNMVRKEQCSFSWDWGPCFAPQGIWKPISLVAFSSALLTDVVPLVTPPPPPAALDTGTWLVSLTAYVQLASGGGGDPGYWNLTLSAAVANVSGAAASATPFAAGGGGGRELALPLQLTVDAPQLWWPAGYGAQPLYELSTTLTISSSGGGGGGQQEWSQTVVQMVGFRKFELVTDALPAEANGGGSSMFFRVNEVPVFVKGANWIPADAFESRVSDERLQQLLQSAADANMNTVRNWGGGIYQHDAFYAAADRLGLMVWQEFMFACAMYPRDDAFLQSVAGEIGYQVRRLAYHPALVLWSGSNENEAALSTGWFPQTEPLSGTQQLYVADYTKLYFDTVHATLAAGDASRPFWPSSPSNGMLSQQPFVGIWGNPYDPTQGDLHYYNYEAKCDNVSSFPTPRFASEYGFQSFPSLYTWLPVTESADLAYDSALMQHRQHHPNGTAQLLAQLALHFAAPAGASSNTTQFFDDWCYLTQCMQALCIKAESEHYRRHKSQAAMTMGAIYWQLNDIWQAPTWSSLEYDGRWKPLHYRARDFFAPLLISSVEQPPGNYSVWVTSDQTQPLHATASVQFFAWSAAAGEPPLAAHAIDVQLPALGNAMVFQSLVTDLPPPCATNAAACFVLLQLLDGDGDDGAQLLASNAYFLADLVDVALPPTTLSSTVALAAPGVANVTITASAVSPWLFAESPIAGRWSDNALLVAMPGVPVQLQFFAAAAQNLTLSDFEATLKIRSIQSTLPEGGVRA